MRLLSRAAVILALVLLAIPAALAAGLVQALAPAVPAAGPCENAGGRPSCEWLFAGNSPGPAHRRLSLLVEEAGDGRFRASAVLTVDSSDPIADLLQRGDAVRDPGAFAGIVIGGVILTVDSFSGPPLKWSVPTVDTGARTGRLTVSTMATEPSDPLYSRPTSRAPLNVRVYLNSPGDVTLRTRSWVVGGARVKNGSTIGAQSAHQVSAKGDAGAELSADVASSAAVSSGDSSPAAVPGWLSRSISWGWPTVRQIGGSVLAATVWIALFLAGRFGLLGRIGRRPVWRRAEWAIGMVLAAHLVLSSVGPIGTIEAKFWNTERDRLRHVLPAAGLWSPSGFPQVTGGVVTFMALVVCLAAPWSRRTPGRGEPARPRAGAVAAFAGALVTVGGFAFLVHSYGRHPARAGDPLTVWALPVAALSALVLLSYLTTWLSGTSVSPLDAGPAPSRSPVRAGLGIVLLIVAALIAARTLYWALTWTPGPDRIYPYNDDLVFLLGGLVVAVTLGALAVRAARSSPRTWIPLGLIAAALTALPLAFWRGPSLLGVTPPDPDEYAPRWSSFFLSPYPLITAAATLVAACFLGATVAARPWTRRGHAPITVATTIGALSMVATLHGGDGYVSLLVRWGGLLGVAVLGLLAVTRLTFTAVTGSRLRTRTQLMLVPAGVLAAVPWGDLRRPGTTVGWWSLDALAIRLDGVLILVLVATLVAVLRRLGTPPVTLERTLTGHRLLGAAVWFIVLSGNYSLLGEPQVGALVTAALGAWLLIPRDQVHRAHLVLTQTPREQGGAVHWTIRAGAARRALGRAMRDKVASDAESFAAGQDAIAALEDQSADPATTLRTPGGRVAVVPTQERAFGSLTSRRPWERAKWGAATGAVIGAPWTILGLVGAGPLSSGTEGYPLFAWAAAVAPLVLFWAGHGLAYGYFFPLLRGQTGLGKSTWLFICALLPAVISTALRGAHANTWNSTGLLAIQLFAFTMTIGVLADRRVLLKYGSRPGRLVDVHNLWSVSAWASSVAVAIGAAAATLIIAGLQPFVIGVISPPTSTPASTPPSAVSHP